MQTINAGDRIWEHNIQQNIIDLKEKMSIRIIVYRQVAMRGAGDP
jgi:hypothetical protein